MAFYDLPKAERIQKVAEIRSQLQQGLAKNCTNACLMYFLDADTYIRKSAYQAIGKMFVCESSSRPKIIATLIRLQDHPSEWVRQTVVNAAGEIGMVQFEEVQNFFDAALFDKHYKVRNAVIGSLKKMGQRNPSPVLAWARTYLSHPDKEVRREICHGIELRGRTHPEDILPLLELLQDDPTKRVRDTLVHVLGQISYKNGCLAKVVAGLNM